MAGKNSYDLMFFFTAICLKIWKRKRLRNLMPKNGGFYYCRTAISDESQRKQLKGQIVKRVMEVNGGKYFK